MGKPLPLGGRAGAFGLLRAQLPQVDRCGHLPRRLILLREVERARRVLAHRPEGRGAVGHLRVAARLADHFSPCPSRFWSFLAWGEKFFAFGMPFSRPATCSTLS